MERWRVFILIDKARRGDEAATDELMRLALRGDPDARAVIVQGVSRSPDSKEKGDPDDGEAACSGIDYSDGLRDLLDLAILNPARALPQIHLELRRADNSACRTAALLATLAQLLKRKGHYREANSVLDYAESISAGCPAMAADLGRRRAILRADEGRHSEGLVLIGKPLAFYRAIDGTGHDPAGNGIADCLFTRADLKFHLGDKKGAGEDLGACLELLGPKQNEDLFGYAMLNLAIIYSRMDRESQKESFKMFGQIRRRFRGHRGESVPRALLDWWESMAQLALNEGKPGKAIKRLMGAQRFFIHEGMLNEAIAITADIVRALGIDTDRIKAFLGDGLPQVRTVVGSRQFGSLLDTLERVTRPKEVNLERLDKATAALRRAAEGPNIFPSLV